MADEKNTQFNYLLNAFEHASQSDKPAENGYGQKRRALLAHVRELERDAARYRWLRNFAAFTILEEAFQSDPGRHPTEELDAAIDAALGDTPAEERRG
jgi:hypothetical protein